MGGSTQALPPVARLGGHEAPVLRLVLDQAGGRGFSADSLGVVRAFRLEGEPAELWRVQEPGAVYALALASTGKTEVLVAAGAYERLSIFARDDGRPRTHLVLAGSPGSVRDLAYVPGRGAVYAVTQRGEVLAYELASGKRLLAGEAGLAAGAQSCAVRAEGEAGAALVAVGASDGTLALLQHSAAGLTRVAEHVPVAEAVLYGTTFLESGPGGLLVLASDGTLLHQPSADAPPQPLAKATQQHYALAVTDDASHALVAGEPREIAVHALPAGNVVARLATNGEPIWSLAVSADKRLAAAGDAKGNVLLYDLAAALV